jgi:hypothetical protein
MRTFTISDELYEQLKRYIVDPFDDTPEVVIERLMEIVDKARSRWSPFEAYDPPEESPRPAEPSPEQHRERPPEPPQARPLERHRPPPAPRHQEQEEEVIL